MSAENGKQIPFSELKKLRRQFAPGEHGKIAFRLIAKGTTCNFYEGNNSCTQPATETLDFDVFQGVDQIPVCGQEHAEKVEQAVNTNLAKQGWKVSFVGKNGFGRSEDRQFVRQNSRSKEKGNSALYEMFLEDQAQKRASKNR